MSNNNNIVVSIQFEKADTTQAFSGISSQAKSAGTRAAISFSDEFSGVVTSKFASIKNSIGSTIAGIFAFNAAKSVFSDVTSAALEFEKSIAEINTIMPDSIRLTEQQTDSLKRLSFQYGTNATEQAQGFYQAISSGITSTAEATRVLESSNKLAIGGITSVKKSIDILTTVINSYGVEAVSAEEASDSLFTAVRIGKTTVEELATSLGLAVPSAKAAGVGLDELNASVATLTNKGFETSVAVTRVNALLTAMARNGKVLGDELNITAVKSVGLVEVLKRLDERYKGNSEKLLELLGRQEAVQAAQVLGAQGAKDLGNALVQFGTKAGAATKAFNIFSETASFRFDKLKSRIESLAITIGSKLLPPFLKFAETLAAITGLTSGVKNELTEVNDKLSKTRKALNMLTDKSKDLEGGSLFGLKIFVSQKEIDENNKNIEKVKARLQSLTEERARILAERSAQGGEAPPVLPTSDEVVEKDAEILNSLDLFVASTKEKFGALAEFFNETKGRISAIGKEISSIVFNVIATGVGKAFYSVGVALRKGENAFAAFAEALKSILADVASSIGDVFIKWGIANIASGNYGMGAAQIAAGGALKVLAGFLGGSSGPSTDGNSAAIGRAGTSTTESADINSFNDQERVDPSTNVSVVVQGSLVQQDELGRFITETLNESFAKQGVTLTDARIRA